MICAACPPLNSPFLLRLIVLVYFGVSCYFATQQRLLRLNLWSADTDARGFGRLFLGCFLAPLLFSLQMANKPIQVELGRG